MATTRKNKVTGADLLSKYSITDGYQQLHWEGSFVDYLDMVRKDPSIVRNAYQRLYDMVVSHGHEDYEKYREKFRRWKFFDDESGGGKDAVFGIDKELNNALKIIDFGTSV